MHVQKVPCPKCYAPTERLRGAMGMQDRRCSACKYEGRGRWQFVWDNHEAPMSRKELDRLNEKPKSWDQLYDEQLARWKPEIKKYRTAIVPSREEWIAKQQAADENRPEQRELTFDDYWRMHIDAVERGWSELLEPPFGLVKEAIKKGLLSKEEYERHQQYLADQEIVGDPEKNPPEDISGGIS